MTDDRPRIFAWVMNENAAGVGSHPAPQIIFTDPMVGCAGLQIIAQRPLRTDEFHHSIHALARRYPAPRIETLKVGG